MGFTRPYTPAHDLHHMPFSLSRIYFPAMGGIRRALVSVMGFIVRMVMGFADVCYKKIACGVSR